MQNSHDFVQSRPTKEKENNSKPQCQQKQATIFFFLRHINHSRTHYQERSDGEEATSSASAGFAPKAQPTAASLTSCGLGRTVDYMLSKGSRDAVPLDDISRDLDVALKCPREKCVSRTATQAADRAVSGREPFVSIQKGQFDAYISLQFSLLGCWRAVFNGEVDRLPVTVVLRHSICLSLSLSLSRSSSWPLRRIGYCPLTPRWISDRFFVGRTGTRSQNTVFLASPSKKQQSGFNEPGSWSTIYERHRFLLTMLALLAFLCTIYLYFAVTLGATGSCSGMSGAEKALCQAKSSLHKGKLKFF
ncbi:hypothetical protein C4D60_Mb02t06910 [Musa balbisiana]|uniref:Uncharacterized protein n=1 Tax=Musa balbisiana TaxID=52838 RepID=A0A4S8IB52_MUSBA|nr:hypothetical protein C4D60_Mb02t06910 [Musa balbisiana]